MTAIIWQASPKQPLKTMALSSCYSLSQEGVIIIHLMCEIGKCKRKIAMIVWSNQADLSRIAHLSAMWIVSATKLANRASRIFTPVSETAKEIKGELFLCHIDFFHYSYSSPCLSNFFVNLKPSVENLCATISDFPPGQR